MVHLLAVLPADEGIAGSRFFAKRQLLAVSHRFRPRFAVQQDVCNRERPGFPNSREFHIFIDGDVDFSVGSGRIAVPLLVLPAREKMPFLCGRFEGDGLALLHRLAAASAYAAVRVDFDAHQRAGELFPLRRERHIFRDGDVDFSVSSGRIAVPLLVLPACEKMPFLCGRFEGDGLALLHRLAAASAYAAVRVDFDAHQDCFIRSDERQSACQLPAYIHPYAVFRGRIWRVVVIPAVDFYAAVAIGRVHVRGVGQFDCRTIIKQKNIRALSACRIVVNPV